MNTVIRLKYATRLVVSMLLMVTVVFGTSLRAGAAYDVTFANFWMGKVSPGSGYIGVDIWWNSGNGSYLPCHNSSDIYYDACELSNNARSSYYKVENYTASGSTFPYGIFIDNQNNDHCGTSGWCRDMGDGDTVRHGWARIIADGALEIYPHTSGSYNPSNATVGGVRIQASFFSFANQGRYSSNIGDVGLPVLGQENVGRLNGFITVGSNKAGNNRVLMEIFQEQSTRFTSTGYPMTGFSSVHNNVDGYYNTGPLPSGTYKIYITDTQTNHKIILRGVKIYHSYERLDFNINLNCFGYSSADCSDPA